MINIIILIFALFVMPTASAKSKGCPDETQMKRPHITVVVRGCPGPGNGRLHAQGLVPEANKAVRSPKGDMLGRATAQTKDGADP